MPLWISLLRVTGRAGGAGCACLRQDANAAVVVVTDRLRSDLGSYEEEKAATEFLLVPPSSCSTTRSCSEANYIYIC